MKIAFWMMVGFAQLSVAQTAFASQPAVCDINSTWSISASTDTQEFNGSNKCEKDWQRDIVLSLQSNCEESLGMTDVTFQCRVFENDKLVQDWSACSNGSVYTAKNSCGRYDIEVYGAGFSRDHQTYYRSETQKVSVEFWAD